MQPMKGRSRAWFAFGAIAAVAALALVLRWHSRPPAAYAPESDTFPDAAYQSDATAADYREEARRVATDLAGRFPSDPRCLDLLARVEQSAGRLEAAEAIWQKWLALDPKAVTPAEELGSAAMKRGNQDRAAELFRRVLAVDPQRLAATVLLGQVLLDSGQAAHAVELLEPRASQPNPSPAVLSVLGQAWSQLGEHARARDALERVVKANPADASAWYRLGRSCARLGDQARAAQCRERFAVLAREDQQQTANRMRAADDVAEMRRLAVTVLFRAGTICQSQGDPESAEDLWRRAAALDPRNVDAREQLVAYYSQTDQIDKALRRCRELRTIDPNHVEHWLSEALLLARAGRFDAARDAVQEALRLDPHNPRCQEVDEAIRSAAAR